MSQSILEELLHIPAFQDLPETELNWVLEHGIRQDLEAGSYLFRKGDPANAMWIMLRGKVQLLLEQNGQIIPSNTFGTGEISGLLPYSRLKIAAGSGMVIEEASIFSIHRDQFRDMIHQCPELVSRLVIIMTSRIREFTRSQEQREKLVSLGKLSAGLAHEFNNPVAAIARSTSELEKRLATFPQQIAELAKGQLRPEQISTVLQLIQCKIQPSGAPLTSLERSDREEELINWLEDRNIPDSGQVAETLVDCGVFTKDLEYISEKISPGALPSVIAWMDSSLASTRLVSEIEQSARRISALVEAVKTYTHMDQATDKHPVDLHPGIRSTLEILNHKLVKKNIRVKLDFQPQAPRIMAYVSELNQAWTNLIDNAIDALSMEGELQISTHTEGNFFVVRIRDNGSGIHPEVLPKIFDPFFTTKGIGQGTGLGLDIVNRVLVNHHAFIAAKSEAGWTEFTISFPLGE